MSEFDAATAVEPAGDGTYRATIADGWDIGGIPNGGYLLTVVGRAVLDAAGRPDPIAVNARFLLPTLPGPVTVRTELVRAGKYHATVRASLHQDDRETMAVVATVGDLSSSPDDSPLAPPPPELGNPGDGVGRAEGGSYVPPPIVDKVELRMDRNTTGFASGAPSGAGVMRAWMRFADGREPDSLAMLTFVDALPPAVFETAVTPAWTPTVELSVHCLRRPGAGWVACATEVGAIVGDYLTEDGRVWDAAGRLVAVSRQLAMMPRG